MPGTMSAYSTGDAKSGYRTPQRATTVIATFDHHQVTRTEVLRSARKIMDGMVFEPNV